MADQDQRERSQTHDGTVQKANSTRTCLVVKHVPSSLVNDQSKAKAYFEQYKAIDTRVMTGVAMKGTVFLDFANPADANEAYYRLEQESKRNSEFEKLRIEYAKPDPKRTWNYTDDYGNNAEPVAPNLGIQYPSNPHLRYRYPDPTPEILSNIMHAIATVPRLYVQTLHLMNKMNLPPPFGPLQEESIPAMMKPGAKRKYDELVASDESELESDEEEKNRKEEEEKRKRQILAAQEQKKALLRQSSSAATKAPAPSTTESDKKQIKFALNKPS